MKNLKDLSVSLIAITTPLNQNMTSDDLISYCARVSNPSNQENFETSSGLLNYCIREKHWSVFEMVNLVLEVNAPRDITRQILRHDANFQEFSGRYADPTNTLGFMVREARLQDPKNRQNTFENVPAHVQQEWEHRQRQVILLATETYNWAVSQGIGKECARVPLPEGNLMSRMYVNNDLRGWIHYAQVRMLESTQKEHRIIATKVWDILVSQFAFLEKYEEK